jgi:hypothetical protein
MAAADPSPSSKASGAIAMKFDQGKSKLSLCSLPMLEAISEAREFGAKNIVEIIGNEDLIIQGVQMLYYDIFMHF